MRRIVAPHQSPIHQSTVKVIVTDIIGASFKQGNRHRRAERIADGRQIAFKQLVLQGFRPCGNNRFTAPKQGRYKVGEGFARARACLKHCARGVVQRLRDRLRHFQLLRAWVEKRQTVRECAIRAENLCEVVALLESDGVLRVD